MNTATELVQPSLDTSTCKYMSFDVSLLKRNLPLKLKFILC